MWTTANLKEESYDVYDYFVGMTHFRSAFHTPSPQAILAHEKGFIFVLEAIHQQAAFANSTLTLPNRDRIDDYISQLLNVEFNALQIEEVKKSLLGEEKNSIAKLAETIIDMQDASAAEILKESIVDRTILDSEEMLLTETVMNQVFTNETFRNAHGPIDSFIIGASDAYHLFTPVKPKVNTDFLNRMWDIEVK
jgi:hypothetical protein